MMTPFAEAGRVPAGKVVVFITEDNHCSILQAGDEFKIPVGKFSGTVLGLNEELMLSIDHKKVKNMGGRAVIDGAIPAQLFPELG